MAKKTTSAPENGYHLAFEKAERSLQMAKDSHLYEKAEQMLSRARAVRKYL